MPGPDAAVPMPPTPAHDSSDDIARVLLVDDDELDRTAIKRALAKSQAKVILTECATATDALAAVDQSRFACVLLDYMLPGTTALELLPSLRPRLNGTPVIVLTGHGDEQTAVEFMKAGASDYLAKDRIDAARLGRAIEQAVSLSAARRGLERSENAKRVYLARLSKLVELTPKLYGEPTIEGRMQLALRAVQALFAAEEVFIAFLAVDPPLLRVSRGEAAEALGPGDARWRDVLGAVRELPPTAGETRVTVSPWDGDGTMCHSLPLRAGGGPPIGVLGMRLGPTTSAFSELTESLFAQLGDMVAVALENARLYESAQRAVAARDAVVAVVSHDLRSPLNSFGLGIALLRESDGAQANAPTLDRMQRAVTHMNRLIDDLLDVSRIERGELQIKPAATSVRALLDETAALCAPVATAAGVQLKVGARSDTRVLADRHRVLQVLANLVSNAVKFSTKGSEVDVEAVVDDHVVTFVVTDRGRGLTADQLPRVFERYYRQGGKGLGLGLYIAKAVVDAHGGRIWVESKPNEGARFRFTLKRA